MRSNEGLADALADVAEQLTGVIPRLRGGRLPGAERLRFVDDLTKLSKVMAELAPLLGDVARNQRLSLFQDGTLPVDSQP